MFLRNYQEFYDHEYDNEILEQLFENFPVLLKRT